jgi:hypothetical protein
MSPTTLLLFLAGHRESIRQVATHKHSIWIGALFVLSAALAREYDGEYLLADPQYLLIPFAASLVASFFLFNIVYAITNRKSKLSAGYLACWRSFLGLFWMTAPLAWLYAIPVERFMDALGATKANAAFLGIVALWRVVLMARIISVVFGMRGWFAFCVSGMFGLSLVFGALFFTPIPLIQIMGGIRQTESEALIAGIVTMFVVLSPFILLLLAIGCLVLLFSNRGFPRPMIPLESENSALTPQLIFTVAASLVIWLGFMPFTQPEQRLRVTVEDALRGGEIELGLELMSSHSAEDFPPHWDPPPRIGYGDKVPNVADVLARFTAESPATWVRNIYFDKLSDYLGARPQPLNSSPEYRRIAEIVSRLPDASERFPKLRIKENEANPVSPGGESQTTESTQ